jgi:hypothetical protein
MALLNATERGRDYKPRRVQESSAFFSTTHIVQHTNIRQKYISVHDGIVPPSPFPMQAFALEKNGIVSFS